MKLSEMTIKDYVDILSSDAGAPGGGSASALTGAQAAAMCAMVCALSVGRKKYAEFEELLQATKKRTEELSMELVSVMDRDTLAFNEVSAVFTMPRDTDEEKAARSAAMQKALKLCTLVPLEAMEKMEEGIRLVHGIVGKSNTSAASDLGCAALNFKAGMEGAWYAVAINLSGIKDEEFVNENRQKAEKLREVYPLVDEILEKVVELL